MLQKLVDDPKINLKINIRDFENKNQRKLKGDNNFNYRDIRNAIGHGDSDSFIKDILKADINKETKSLLRTVDNIFSEISTHINMYRNHL